ncbi:MAG: fosfomycin resistance glutathione transferase [Gammaproteobacteria bacterium]|nr:fosfomycin resistance glutathione transferase [Gammaproteobacteria bacterium]
MISGLNHITLAVTGIDQSVHFYQKLLGFDVHVIWDQGAYLTLGSLWLCLSLDNVCSKSDYTHFAFGVSDEEFSICKKILVAEGVQQWKENSSEGDSFYFLDPDGHKLELHVGSLQTRLDTLKENPYAGMRWF